MWVKTKRNEVQPAKSVLRHRQFIVVCVEWSTYLGRNRTRDSLIGVLATYESRKQLQSRRSKTYVKAVKEGKAKWKQETGRLAPAGARSTYLQSTV